MSTRIRIDGIYDQRTISSLESLGICDLGFDFRPTSFNFLQQHMFLSLLKKAPLTKSRYFLRYENEQDFVIQKMLDDLKVATNIDSGTSVNFNEFFLEFSDNKEADFYDQFDIPFYWHYQPDASLGTILAAQNIKGIVLNFSLLKEVHEQSHFNNFVQNFFQLSYKAIETKSLEVVLCLDWDSDIFPSLFDFIDFDFLALPINNKIEVCYRNVDLNKIQKNLGHYQSLSI